MDHSFRYVGSVWPGTFIWSPKHSLGNFRQPGCLGIRSGIVFAAVRLVSGSLLAPIVLHAIFDAAALVAAGGFKEMLDDTFSVERLLIPGAIFAIWGAVSIFIVQKRRAKAQHSATPRATRSAGDSLPHRASGYR